MDSDDLEVYKMLIKLANDTFGAKFWSMSVSNTQLDFIEETSPKRFSAGAMALVRIQLMDGAVREDLGYGSTTARISKGGAIAIARKKAVLDGLKGAIMNFGGEIARKVQEVCLTNPTVAPAGMTRSTSITYNTSPFKTTSVNRNMFNAPTSSGHQTSPAPKNSAAQQMPPAQQLIPLQLTTAAQQPIPPQLTTAAQQPIPPQLTTAAQQPIPPLIPTAAQHPTAALQVAAVPQITPGLQTSPPLAAPLAPGPVTPQRMTEEEQAKAERKRRQRQKQEEFRQKLLQQKMNQKREEMQHKQHQSEPPQKNGGTEAQALDEDEDDDLLSTQVMEAVVRSAANENLCTTARQPILTSPSEERSIDTLTSTRNKLVKKRAEIPVWSMEKRARGLHN